MAKQPSPGSEGSQYFKNPTHKILWDLQNVIFDVLAPPLQWSLWLVLNQVMKQPFEPMATVELRILTYTTYIAITSVQRASVCTFSTCTFSTFSCLFCSSTRIRFAMFADMSFCPKWFLIFTSTSILYLQPSFHCLLRIWKKTFHTLDVRQALAFYTSRTKHL